MWPTFKHVYENHNIFDSPIVGIYYNTRYSYFIIMHK